MLSAFSPLKHIVSLTAVFLFATLTVAVFISKVDPIEANLFGLFLFYTALFLAFSAAMAVAGYLLRAVRGKNSPLGSFAAVSVRQGLLVGAMLTVMLFLQRLGSLTFLSAVLLFLSLALLEIAFQAK